MACKITPLAQETRAAIPTLEAAQHLSRQPQTLRRWACQGGPITPLHVNNRLLWPVAALRALLGGAA